MGGVDLENNPGAVLLKLGLGLSEDAICPEFSWNEQLLLKEATRRSPMPCAYIYKRDTSRRRRKWSTRSRESSILWE